MKPSLLIELAFVAFFAIAVIFSYLTNGLLLKFSRTLGNRQVQHRKNIRWSSTVKPSIGGLSFYILFLISISIYGIYDSFTAENLSWRLLGLVFAVTTGFLLGLADDAYDTIPTLKFCGQLLCGIFLVVSGTIIPATNVLWLDALITLIWVVGIMNSINMLDNMDGLAGTVSLFIIFACMLVLAVEQQLFSFYMVLLLGVLGALTGFLFHNWPPAKLYMGDTGSQFLGAFIAGVTIPILWRYHEPSDGMFQVRQFLIPLAAFSVPILDTTTVFIRRLARGRSPFVGGRDHVSHHFVYAGLNEQQSILVLGGLSFISAVLTAFLVLFRRELSVFQVVLCYSLFTALFLVVQLVYDSGARKMRHRQQEEKKVTEEPSSAGQSASA